MKNRPEHHLLNYNDNDLSFITQSGEVETERLRCSNK